MFDWHSVMSLSPLICNKNQFLLIGICMQNRKIFYFVFIQIRIRIHALQIYKCIRI